MINNIKKHEISSGFRPYILLAVAAVIVIYSLIYLFITYYILKKLENDSNFISRQKAG